MARPRHPVPSRAAPRPSAPAAPAWRPVVLVVDDDPVLLSKMTKALAGCATVLAASSFESAAALIREGGCDAAVVDIGLGDGSGLDLSRALRTQTVPAEVLLVTGNLTPEAVNLAQGMGAEIVAKPFGLATLTDFVDRMIAATRAARLDRATESYGDEKRLSGSQRRIARLAVDGARSSELAERMGIARSTVKTQVRALLKKAAERNIEAVARTILYRALGVAA